MAGTTNPLAGTTATFGGPALAIGAAPPQSKGFETGLGMWSIPGPPVGSPSGTVGFSRARTLFSAGVITDDTILLGFGVEQLGNAAERVDVLGKAVKHLLK